MRVRQVDCFGCGNQALADLSAFAGPRSRADWLHQRYGHTHDGVHDRAQTTDVVDVMNERFHTVDYLIDIGIEPAAVGCGTVCSSSCSSAS
jgi:hypothetical protein